MVSYILIIYLVVINLYTFVLMGSDKKRAKLQRRRVPEKRLFTLSAVGGAVGTYWAMKAFRHKTQHRSFTIGIPLLILLNAALVIWLFSMLILPTKS